MATGANTAPMGKLHPILAAKMAASSSSSDGGSKDPELRKHLQAAKRAASALFPAELPSKKKARKSRWSEESSKMVLPGLPTVLPANMKEDEQKLYLMHLKIESIGRQLRTGEFDMPANPADRSPSPEPIYSHDGKRLNTREVRTRKKLEEERHELVQQAINLNPEYRPPADYKAMTKKFEDKVFIPQDHHPQTNFVGLLIGPRGHTLKQLERDTETKIMIRGKGAAKDGKVGRSLLPQPGEDEPLHALITGYTPETVKHAVDKINNIIQSGIDVPGNDNDLKKLQLQQLAELNGTFKPLDIIKCRNCGLPGHRDWECSTGTNITSSIVCTRCGGGGHIASDCRVDLSEIQPSAASVTDKAKMDSEYLSLMKELGEKVPETAKGSTTIRPTSELTGKANPGGVAPPAPWMTPQAHGYTGPPALPAFLQPVPQFGQAWPPLNAPILPMPVAQPLIPGATPGDPNGQPAPWQQPWPVFQPPLPPPGAAPPTTTAAAPLPPEQPWAPAAPPPPPPTESS